MSLIVVVIILQFLVYFKYSYDIPTDHCQCKNSTIYAEKNQYPNDMLR